MRKNKIEKIRELREKIETKFGDYESFFSKPNVNPLDLDEKIKEVNSLIEHVNQRINYTESRITRTVTFSLTLIGIGMAFFAVTIKLHGLSFYLGLVTTGLFILIGSVTSIIHAFQVNPKYPFRALENDWKWFYPKIVNEKYKPSTFVMECESKYLKKRLLHIEGLQKYAEKVVDENKIERLKVDVQQLYLLHVNEKYKNYFLTSLRRVLTWGLLLTLITLIILFVTIAIEQAKIQQQTDKVIQGEQIKSSTHKEKSPSDQIKLPPSSVKGGTEKIKSSPSQPVK